ncbi:carbohydrate sulfotransferase 11-like [Strongylocentrotus purpuratus]|uniref:Carbohydrate sulfotransferase n=1 Tax=Strongylocentrotus purpuratus TaxID=7668 RepID=A0A7M7PQF2_STRPU|nr:carbohydrate sulfotransferase 11-like [Strongylocentrotus purpuratus]XP_030853525.1 carbohydrate sulfotransferase 11-like [Strongylocentrotus purpuratus]XP_030853532.1 carbohydrate sulfotransferase 11-like [Strongylocentrotus purpuratus]|eukprot:XP_001184911.2 PREDICTED: carbohydrate sulfotransferase 11 [Strongylocentrotus purpuratus]
MKARFNMASMSKFALWCALILMLTFTLLVYISPSTPSIQSSVLGRITDRIHPEGVLPLQAVNKDQDQETDSLPVHVNIGSSKEEDDSISLLNGSYPSKVSFMNAQKEIQKRRKYNMERVCKKYHPNPETDMAKHPPWNVIVDDKYKLMYCYVQKVACTNWKKVFLVLSGQYNSTASIPQFFTNREGARSLKSLQSYPEAERRHILKTYTKFMFARHPFSRVLSAYRNKLAPDSTFSRAGKWQKKIGTKIMSAFREDAVELRVARQNFNMSNYDLSFGEFVKFIYTPRGQKNGNKHWRDLHMSCLPCMIQYDMIGKIETLEDDARYILSVSGADKVVSFPSAEGSSPTNSSDPDLIQKYFSTLPRNDITKLYNRYLIDFLMFDYHATVDDVLDVR